MIIVVAKFKYILQIDISVQDGSANIYNEHGKDAMTWESEVRVRSTYIVYIHRKTFTCLFYGVAVTSWHAQLGIGPLVHAATIDFLVRHTRHWFFKRTCKPINLHSAPLIYYVLIRKKLPLRNFRGTDIKSLPLKCLLYSLADSLYAV